MLLQQHRRHIDAVREPAATALSGRARAERCDSALSGRNGSVSGSGLGEREERDVVRAWRPDGVSGLVVMDGVVWSHPAFRDG
jgi:hypothetical protein